MLIWDLPPDTTKPAGYYAMRQLCGYIDFVYLRWSVFVVYDVV